MKTTQRDQSKKWLVQIVRWFEEAESKMPEPAFLKGEFPEWVKRLARELMSTLFPVAKLRVGADWTPGEVGALIGHQLAYCHTISSLPRIPLSRAFRKIDKKVVARTRRQIKAFAKSHSVAVQRSLAVACGQSYADSTQFFTAFAKALDKRPADASASNFQRTTTKVYWVLFQAWPSVEGMGSVHELQQSLCNHLEPHLVGNIKRVEKICQRLGLRLGPRGRPKKAEVLKLHRAMVEGNGDLAMV
jgi:hypothetical protein